MPSSVTPALVFSQLLKNNQPQAAAWVTGNTSAPQLSGLVKFYDTPYGGVLIESELFGLPNIQTSGSSDFYKRFSMSDILGRSVVIHSDSDDFSSQPSGNSGNKIGCGMIRRV